MTGPSQAEPIQTRKNNSQIPVAQQWPESEQLSSLFPGEDERCRDPVQQPRKDATAERSHAFHRQFVGAMKKMQQISDNLLIAGESHAED